MITFEIRGLDEFVDKLKSLPSVIDRQGPLKEVSSKFESVLVEATPPGYSGKLKNSVVSAVSDEEAIVGYEGGVETAGNPKLDSVTRPRTRGRSVLWVRVDSLEQVFEDAFGSFSSEAASVLESRFAEQVDGIS